MLPEILKRSGYRAVHPLARLLQRHGVDPDLISWAGVGLALISAYFLSEGWFAAAAVVMLVSGICDMMDGEVARLNRRHSKAGAYLDSCLDRYSEILWFCGLLFYFLGHPPLRQDVIAILFFGITGSMMVSYARARAEGLSVEGAGVLFERPERVVLLLIGVIGAAVWGVQVLVPFLYLLAVGANLGAILRIRNCWRRLLPVGRD